MPCRMKRSSTAPKSVMRIMSKISDNGKKKSGGTKMIAAEDILAMYDAVIPLLSDNPQGLDIPDQINKWMLQFVPYDFGHYVMDDPTPNSDHRRLGLISEKWERFEQEDVARSLSIYPTSLGTAGITFDEEIEKNYQSAIDRHKIKFPEIHHFHYHRIESKTYPRIVIGFFRNKDSRSNNAFTREEKEIFAQATPYIIPLFRAVLNQVYLSQSFQYFSAFAQLGSKLAQDYNLSDTEVKLIPDILFGYSNEEIAERQFVSLATVKTHISHILKKTGTKSRLEFIGKFFTSPESVKL
jgi:DNA-binding CsgD family transcriptional regulator